MHKRFAGLPVDFWFVGRESGGFSERLAPGVGDKNLLSLVASSGAATATCMRVTADQSVVTADHLSGGLTIPAVALITNQLGQALLLRAADCLPIVFYTTTTKPVLALIHGGRRELDADIIARTICQLKDQYDIAPEQLHAYLGPSIESASYRLPTEVVAGLYHPSWTPHIVHTHGQIRLDLFGFARGELIRNGVRAEQITESPTDTATDQRYYSYYATTRHDAPAGMNGCQVRMPIKTTTHHTTIDA